MEKKLNTLDKLNLLLGYLNGGDITQDDFVTVVDFVQHEIELASKKKETAHKSDPLKESFQQAVLSALNYDGVRASDLLQNETLLAFAEENGFPLRIQRITSTLSKLTEGENAPVERFEAKRTAYFRLKA